MIDGVFTSLTALKSINYPKTQLYFNELAQTIYLSILIHQNNFFANKCCLSNKCITIMPLLPDIIEYRISHPKTNKHVWVVIVNITIEMT